MPLYRYDFNYATPNLDTGVTVYTPGVTTVLLDAWVDRTSPWDGTTPRFDIGDDSIDLTQNGWFTQAWNPLNLASNLAAANWGLSQGSLSSVAIAYAMYNDAGGEGSVVHQRVINGSISICVSQNGLAGGAPSGGTSGTASLYLHVATPTLV